MPTREHGLVNGSGVLGLGQDASTARATQRFVRGESNNVGIRNRIGVRATRNETSQVRGVVQEVGANFVGDFFERCRINSTRVTSGASDDHARTMFECKIAHLIHVDALITGRRLVGLEVVQLATRVHWRTVREVTTMIEAETKNSVALVQKSLIYAHICVRARVWLHVCMIGTKQRFHAFDC